MVLDFGGTRLCSQREMVVSNSVAANAPVVPDK